MEIQKTVSMMMQASERIEAGTKEIYKLARYKAEAERNYRIAVAQEKHILKHQGIAVTLIEDLAKGKEEIADLKQQRDLAEDTFKAAVESLRALQSELSALQSISKYQSDI